MIKNAHPVEELHSLRAQISRMQCREAELEAYLLSRAGPSERVGALHYARPETRRTRVLDHELLPRKILEDESHYRFEERTRVVVENLPPELIEPVESPVIGMRWASRRRMEQPAPIEGVAQEVDLQEAESAPEREDAAEMAPETGADEDCLAAEQAFFTDQIAEDRDTAAQAAANEEPPFEFSMPPRLAQTLNAAPVFAAAAS